MSLDDINVWVIDSSALIEMKLIVPISQQWAAFSRLEQMVSDGRIALPHHVINEVGHMTHPDMPGALGHGHAGPLAAPAAS